ncbi:MAG: EAL domain-containing protein [Candidatus Gracilibacteria bacterium]|nr:EAL domain-containing protein [Candidatus Gracilibacteria bacterium]
MQKTIQTSHPQAPQDIAKPSEQIDFTKIHQLASDFRTSVGSQKWDEQNVYKFVQRKFSTINIHDIISAMTIAILSVLKQEDLKTENILLQENIANLVEKVLSMEKELNGGILEVDIDGNILFADDTMIQLSGFSRRDLIGANMNIMNSGEHSKEFWAVFWNTIKSGKIWEGDICNKKKDGTLVWLGTTVVPKIDDDGNVESFKVIRKDKTRSYIPLIDRLTGLGNRAKCLENHSNEGIYSIAILHINDMFDINDALGRDKGDSIIRYIAKILKKFSQEIGAEIYKFEGTDFGIVLKEGVSKEYILKQYEELGKLNIFHEDKRIPLSFSLGIVLNQPDIITLIQHGYLALKESKKTSKPIVFDDANNTTNESKDFLRMRTMVKEAFENNLFVVFFQEIKENACSIKKGGRRKFECLVRMYDSVEKTNLIPPGEFLPVVKKDGKNTKLTNLVIEKICKKMTENDGCFSINLTRDDLLSATFINGILEKISQYSSSHYKYPVTPDRIVFEILEDIEDRNSAKILENIKILKRNFEIAIDDFGSGYSNLCQILDFGANYIKIDMRYIRGIDTNTKHRNLVNLIVGFAHTYDMLVIAEGVETETEQHVLEDIGVDYSQGYLFSKPGPYIDM